MRSSAFTDHLLALLRGSQLWASHLTLVLMVGALFLQIVSRQFDLQIDWTEELSRFAFVTMVFVSASYASQAGSHLRVDAFADLIARWRPAGRLIALIQFLAILAFDSLFFWYCLINLQEGLEFPNISPAIGFNENLLFLAPCVGFGAAVLSRLLTLIWSPRATESDPAGEIQP